MRQLVVYPNFADLIWETNERLARVTGFSVWNGRLPGIIKHMHARWPLAKGKEYSDNLYGKTLPEFVALHLDEELPQLKGDARRVVYQAEMSRIERKNDKFHDLAETFILRSMILELRDLLNSTNFVKGYRRGRYEPKDYVRNGNTLLDVAEDLLSAGIYWHEDVMLILNDVHAAFGQRRNSWKPQVSRPIGDVESDHWVGVARRLHNVHLPRSLVWARDTLYNLASNLDAKITEEFRQPWQVIIMERRLDRKVHHTWYTNQGRPPRGLEFNEHPQHRRTLRDVFFVGHDDITVTPITEIFSLISEYGLQAHATVRVVYQHDGEWYRQAVNERDADLLKHCMPLTVKTSKSSLERLRGLLNTVRALTNDVGAPTNRLMKVDHLLEVFLDPVDFPEIYHKERIESV